MGLLLKGLKITPVLLLLVTLTAYGSDQQKIQQLFKDLKLAKGNDQVRVLLSIAKEYEATSDSVLIILKQAEQVLKQYPNEKMLADVQNNIGMYYRDINKGKTSLPYYLKAMTLYKKLNNGKGLSWVYNNMGSLYMDMRHYKEAKRYYKKSLEIRKSLHDTTGIAYSFNNIATVHYELNEFEEAAAGFSEVLEKYNSYLTSEHEAILTNNVGCCYLEMKKYVNALTYFHEGLRIYEKLNNIEGISMLYGNLAKAYLGLQQYDNAILYGKKAMELARELESTELMEETCTALRKAYLQQGNYKNAYEYMLLEKQLGDTLYDRETRDVIAEMQTKYETREKEKENKLLANENKIKSLELNRSRYFNMALGAVLLLGGLFTFAMVRQNRIKARQRTLLAEQKLLRAQMNPHFIFNSLTAIEAFIYTNKPREAGRYLSDFARLMRLILANSRHEEISLSTEIQTLEYYLAMQKLRLEEKLNWSVRTENITDASDILIPPMLTQPFIENAIEHGVSPDKEKIEVNILFKKEEDYLCIEITDNGVGITHSLQQKAPKTIHKSLAMEITRERLENYNYNRNRKQHISLTVTDLSAENTLASGTKVRFVLPME